MFISDTLGVVCAHGVLKCLCPLIFENLIIGLSKHFKHQTMGSASLIFFFLNKFSLQIMVSFGRCEVLVDHFTSVSRKAGVDLCEFV